MRAEVSDQEGGMRFNRTFLVLKCVLPEAPEHYTVFGFNRTFLVLKFNQDYDSLAAL